MPPRFTPYVNPITAVITGIIMLNLSNEQLEERLLDDMPLIIRATGAAAILNWIAGEQANDDIAVDSAGNVVPIRTNQETAGVPTGTPVADQLEEYPAIAGDTAVTPTGAPGGDRMEGIAANLVGHHTAGALTWVPGTDDFGWAPTVPRTSMTIFNDERGFVDVFADDPVLETINWEGPLLENPGLTSISGVDIPVLPDEIELPEPLRGLEAVERYQFDVTGSFTPGPGDLDFLNQEESGSIYIDYESEYNYGAPTRPSTLVDRANDQNTIFEDVVDDATSEAIDILPETELSIELPTVDRDFSARIHVGRSMAQAKAAETTLKMDAKTKAQMMYMALLSFTNRTWGALSELFDFLAVLFDNIYIDGRKLATFHIKSHAEFLAILRNAHDVRVDQDGVMVGVAREQLTDTLIASMTRAEAMLLHRVLPASHPLLNMYGLPTTWARRFGKLLPSELRN